MKRIACPVAIILVSFVLVPIVLAPWTRLYAQDFAIDEVKAKILDAHQAQRLFASGLSFCGELNATNFYFEPRHRVLDLEDYHAALENLARAKTYNTQTHRPWNAQDADARWQEVKKQAVRDKENCALVASLPELEKRLKEMQSARGAPQTKD